MIELSIPQIIAIKHTLHNHICPHCGERILFCEVKDCLNPAEWEGWMGQRHIVKIKVCEEHKNLLRGLENEE